MTRSHNLVCDMNTESNISAFYSGLLDEISAAVTTKEVTM